MNLTTTPDCLKYRADLQIALQEALRIKEALSAQPCEVDFTPEIQFITEKINGLKKQISAANDDADRVIKLIRSHDIIAGLYAMLHFQGGLTWDEVAWYTSSNDCCRTSAAIKMRVYRVFAYLRQNGYQID